MAPKRKNNKTTIEIIKAFAKEYVFCCVSRIYKTSKNKLIFVCKHGHRFRVSWYRFCRNQQCPKCLIGYQERFVRKVVEKLFVREFIKIRPKWLKYITGRCLELDMYNGDLAFEYNGSQHYKVIRRFRGTKKKLELQQERDVFKQAKCKELGVTLITVPQLFDMLDPYDIKAFIKNELLTAGYPLPKNFDDIEINVEDILAEVKA
jgi:hypothetical protein